MRSRIMRLTQEQRQKIEEVGGKYRLRFILLHGSHATGLRNRLVHEYNNTRQDIICESVSEAVTQYVKYCDSILTFIEKQTTHGVLD